MTSRKGGSATLDEVASDPPVTEAEGEGEQQPAPAPVQEETRRPPALPTEATLTGTSLEHKSIVIYGPAGIGKSTLASEFPDPLFFNTAGELNGINVKQVAIPNWLAFREWSWGVAEAKDKPDQVVIDTTDKLTDFCSDHVRSALGIMHESDAEWGKGWDQFKRALGTNLAKLAQIPEMGLILIGHSKETKIKTRNGEYTKFVPRFAGGSSDVIIDLVDLVLFVDWEGEEGGNRVIKTKPDRCWIAKERGTETRLPEEIQWPLGQSGFEVLKTAWEAGV